MASAATWLVGAWEECRLVSAFSSTSRGRIPSGKGLYGDRVCSLRCAAREPTDGTSAENGDDGSGGGFGRREAVVSLVAAGISVPSANRGFSEASAAKRRLEATAEMAGKTSPPGVLNAETEGAGVTSEYVRPADAGRPLPLSSLLHTRSSPKAKDRAAPSQVFVAIHGDNHMQVSWITDSDGTSAVDYGTSAGTYTATATGSSSFYTYGTYSSGNIHYVVVGLLEEDTTYFYKVGASDTEFSFKTPPRSSPEVPIKFVVVGDLGQTQDTRSTLQHIGSTAYDVLILPGDLSYADGDQSRWDSYGVLVSPLARRRPWMVTQGNHEIEPAPGIEDFRAYNARWRMPYTLSGSPSNLFYSFDVAGVHFLMLGSYACYSRSSEQFKWLQKDLAKVDRLRTPWLIGVVHAPWYNSNFAHQGEGDGMLIAMEDLLFGAQVDVIFAGHVHAYERSVRMYRGRPHSRGILYINIGDGGNREGLAKLYFPQPQWSAFREASYGHGQFSILSRTAALWTWHRNQDDEPVVADSAMITSLSANQSPSG